MTAAPLTLTMTLTAPVLAQLMRAIDAQIEAHSAHGLHIKTVSIRSEKSPAKPSHSAHLIFWGNASAAAVQWSNA